MYQPRPLDTSQVVLRPEILELAELLARNTHELWAVQRLAEGWTYGPQRDDAKRQHPCLVPYEELPAAEQTLDREMALNSLKGLLSLGFQLQPPSSSAPPALSTQAELSADVVRRLSSNEPLGLAVLLGIWESRSAWNHTPAIFRALAQRFIQIGEPLLAYDVAAEGVADWPGDVRLRQLQALALARSGATETANAIARQLRDDGHTDEETLGILARTYKDLALTGADETARPAHLAHAVAAYTEAYRRHGGYWSGINAATLAALQGDTQQAASLAHAIRARCLTDLAGRGVDDGYWLLATLGEAALILGAAREAEDWYGRAATQARREGRLADLASTRRHARLLVPHVPVDAERIEAVLRVPSVAVFDSADVDSGPGQADEVCEAIRRRLAELDCTIGYALVSTPVDVLFVEALEAAGGEVSVVLPYDQDRFLADLDTDDDERAQVAEVLRRATRVVVALPQQTAPGPILSEFAERLLRGLAAAHAQRLDTRLVHLSAADLGVASARPAPVAPAANQSTDEIVAMLFGDAVGFSNLDERQVQQFTVHFLGAIGALIQTTPNPPVLTNTWGDGLFFVFRDGRAAGLFALEVAELVHTTDWTSFGLPASLDLRIGLHAGPVARCTDPITGRPNYLGTQVSRAARIEPITPPGQVYASEPFAALLAEAGVPELACDYVGQTRQAKGYGTFPTYHLRRR